MNESELSPGLLDLDENSQTSKEEYLLNEQNKRQAKEPVEENSGAVDFGNTAQSPAVDF